MRQPHQAPRGKAQQSKKARGMETKTAAKTSVKKALAWRPSGATGGGAPAYGQGLAWLAPAGFYPWVYCSTFATKCVIF
ncbi:hypothetical protein D9M72_561950 [compost metagenome]